MKEFKQTKNIDLTPEVLAKLQALADTDNRNLKNYIEVVLTNHVNKK